MHPSARHSINDFNNNNSNNSNNSTKSSVSNNNATTATSAGGGGGLSLNSSSMPMSSKQIKIGNYFLGATIGKGNSAVVKLATHCLTKQKVAIKIFDKNGLDNDKQIRLRREIDSMKQLKHQHVIKLYEIMETSKLICLVTEYASNGELYNHVLRKKRLSEREARSILKQIVAAVHFCHYNQIVHRDIKVENLLLDSNFRVKLADFGFSAHFEHGELLDVWCGSPPYCAPELYLALRYDGPKADIWSLGVVLYVLVCGYLPFEAQSFNLLRSQVVNGAYKLPFFLSEDCKNLINGILDIDPERRFSMDDIINHRWLKFDHECLMLMSPPPVVSSSHAETDQPAAESFLYQEFRRLIEKIEKISIKDLKIDENILKEITKYGIDPDDVINSIRNNEFDSNAGIYLLLESKYANLSDISSSSSGQHIFRLKSEARSDDVISNSSDSGTTSYESQAACRINVFEAETLGLEETPATLDDEDEDDEEDEEEDDGGDQMIEELGRQYLNRHNSIRRHTIGTNTNHEAHHFNSDLMKSTECLPKLRDSSEMDAHASTPGGTAAGGADYSSMAAATAASLAHELAMFNSNLVNGVLNNSLLNSLLINNSSCSSSPQQAHLVKDLTGIFGGARTQSELAQQLSLTSTWAAGRSIPGAQVNPFMAAAAPSYENDTYGYGSSASQQQVAVKQKNTFKLGHAKQTKLSTGMNAHQPQQQYLSPPNIAGRRASDGGSNISLFSQFYSLKNPYNTGGNSNIYQSNASSKQSRGSITSGIPIFAAMNPPSSEMTSGNQVNAESENGRFGGCFQNRVASLSSGEDGDCEVAGLAKAHNSDALSRFHRKSKSRHEPYLDPLTSNSSASNIFKSKSREQSISGAGYSNHMVAFAHRASEPNPLDLIFAHRAHLEKIYNLSVKQAGAGDSSTLARELKMLQQENPALDERTKVKLQSQHENVMNNLAKTGALCLDQQQRTTPKSSLSSTTSEESTSNGGSSSFTLRNASPTKADSTSADITLMLNNNLDGLSLEPTSPPESASSSSNESQQQLSANQLMSSSALQMIQEEQNEIVPSTSTSLSSSASITPRMSSSDAASSRRT